MSETWDLRPDGLRFWDLVQEGPLLVQSHQNIYRLARDLFVGLLVLGAIAIVAHNTIVTAVSSLMLLIALSVSVWWYWTQERPLGPLLAMISDEAIQIGCERDEIRIPWTAIDIEQMSLPVNSSFMAIPISPAKLETILLCTDDEPIPWDRKLYRRAILSIKYNAEMSWIEVYANPNGFFVNILTVVYPMIGIWRERQIASIEGLSADE